MAERASVFLQKSGTLPPFLYCIGKILFSAVLFLPKIYHVKLVSG